MRYSEILNESNDLDIISQRRLEAMFSYGQVDVTSGRIIALNIKLDVLEIPKNFIFNGNVDFNPTVNNMVGDLIVKGDLLFDPNIRGSSIDLSIHVDGTLIIGNASSSKTKIKGEVQVAGSIVIKGDPEGMKFPLNTKIGYHIYLGISEGFNDDIYNYDPDYITKGMDETVISYVDTFIKNNPHLSKLVKPVLDGEYIEAYIPEESFMYEQEKI